MLSRLYLGLFCFSLSTVSQFFFSWAFFNFLKKILKSRNFQTIGS